MVVGCGAMLNVIPINTLKNIGKRVEDLTNQHEND